MTRCRTPGDAGSSRDVLYGPFNLPARSAACFDDEELAMLQASFALTKR